MIKVKNMVQESFIGQMVLYMKDNFIIITYKVEKLNIYFKCIINI